MKVCRYEVYEDHEAVLSWAESVAAARRFHRSRRQEVLICTEISNRPLVEGPGGVAASLLRRRRRQELSFSRKITSPAHRRGSVAWRLARRGSRTAPSGTAEEVVSTGRSRSGMLYRGSVRGGSPSRFLNRTDVAASVRHPTGELDETGRYYPRSVAACPSSPTFTAKVVRFWGYRIRWEGVTRNAASPELRSTSQDAAHPEGAPRTPPAGNQALLFSTSFPARSQGRMLYMRGLLRRVL